MISSGGKAICIGGRVKVMGARGDRWWKCIGSICVGIGGREMGLLLVGE